MSEKQTIRLRSDILRQVQQHLDDGHKIKAIKLARSEGKAYPGIHREDIGDEGNPREWLDRRPGLKHAKDAVEHLNGSPLASCVFVRHLTIKRFVVDTDEGEIEMDLEGLQLKLLGNLNHIPMGDVAEMLELITFIRKWQGDIE